MSFTIMVWFTSRARVSCLVLAPLLATLSGCSSGCNKGNEGATADETSAASRAAVTPSPLSVRAAGVIEGRLLGATPVPTPGAEDMAPPDYDPLFINTDVDIDSGGAPLTVNLTAEIEGGPPGLHYRWDFGDNTPPSQQLKVQHTYQEPGEYTATFWVTGPPDIEESREVNIEVTEEGFDFDIETDSDIGSAPLKVEFTARLDEDLPGPFYFQWEFGDGARDVSNPTTHVYRKPGTYTASVTVTNAQGQRATRDVEITVDAPEDSVPEDQ